MENKIYKGVGKNNKGELIGSGQDAYDYIKWYFQQKYPDDRLINDFIDITFDNGNKEVKEELEGWFFSSGDWTYYEEQD